MQPCAKGTRNGLGPFDKPSSGIDATDAIGITSQSISASVMYVLCATLAEEGQVEEDLREGRARDIYRSSRLR
jgi:hypothetical protein